MPGRRPRRRTPDRHTPGRVEVDRVESLQSVMKVGLLRNLVSTPGASALSVIGAVSLIAASACASSPTVSSTSQTPTAVGGSGQRQPASPSGGCGDTPARLGGRPAWMPEPDDSVTPYVLAVPDMAAVILTVQPLRAGHSAFTFSATLWVTLLRGHAFARSRSLHRLRFAAGARPAHKDRQPRSATHDP